jgi:hypothetical protein
MVIKSHNTTPASSKHGEGTTHAATTVGSKKLGAKFLHFETCLLQEDLLKKAQEIHTVLSGDDERAKKKIPNVMKDLLTGLRVVGERLHEINVLMQQVRDCKDYIAGKRKETNATIKITQRGVPIEKRKSPEELRLGLILKEAGPVRKKSKTAQKLPPISKTPDEFGVSVFVAANPPKNESHYTYLELVTAFSPKGSPFFGKSVRKVWQLLNDKGLVVCSRESLQRQIRHYIEQGKLPPQGADGSTNGRPALIDKENINMLNENIFRNVGSTSSIAQFAKTVEETVKQQRLSQGLPELLVTPTYDHKTVKKYFEESSVQPGVSLVPASTVRTQGIRRQMAARHQIINIL